uniref:Protrudin n=1 Tax=Fundulus heteroclitus TaxID=8078 RepID=A0A3Q2QGE2_FUNHE
MHSTGEASQGSGDRAELVPSLYRPQDRRPPELGSPDPSELGSPRCAQNFDLLNMVVSYKRMALFLEPVVDGVELIRYLIRWKMPVCSLLVLVFLNVFLCTVTEGTSSVVAVSAPAALGYLQDRCGSRTSDAELQKRRFHAVHRRDLQTVNLTRQEAMLEIKDLLKHLDEMMSSACQSAEAIYKVLYWDDHATSSRFYGAVFIVVCLLYVAPLGWVFAVLNSVVFLWNRDFYRGWLIRQEDDDGPIGAPEYDTVSENGFLSRNEPIRSKVSKLTERLRKRYPTTSTGNCSSCNAVFSVLKKRRNCSNCGNSFCSRCCSFKVLRSCMGATAPEAQRETVFVCAACNSSLLKLQ